MPFDRKLYPANWNEIRAAILDRANHLCEFCGLQNYSRILRFKDGSWEPAQGNDIPEGARAIKVVLTIAHLDHDPQNSDPANLRALCQQCHLRYDAKHHAQTRKKKKGQLSEREKQMDQYRVGIFSIQKSVLMNGGIEFAICRNDYPIQQVGLFPADEEPYGLYLAGLAMRTMHRADVCNRIPEATSSAEVKELLAEVEKAEWAISKHTERIPAFGRIAYNRIHKNFFDGFDRVDYRKMREYPAQGIWRYIEQCYAHPLDFFASFDDLLDFANLYYRSGSEDYALQLALFAGDDIVAYWNRKESTIGKD